MEVVVLLAAMSLGVAPRILSALPRRLRLDEEFNFFFNKSASAVLFGLLSFEASDFWIDGLLCWRLSYAVCFASRTGRDW